MKRFKIPKRFTSKNDKTTLILIIGLAFIIILTLPQIIKSITSSSYEMPSSTLSSGGFAGNSANYKTITSAGEFGADVYSSPSYQIQIGFPATSKKKQAAGGGGGNVNANVNQEITQPGSEGIPEDANGDGDYTDPGDDYDGDGIPNDKDPTPLGDNAPKPGSVGTPKDADKDGSFLGPNDDYDGDGIPNKDDSTPWDKNDNKKGQSSAIPDAIGKSLDNVFNAINQATPEAVKKSMPVVVLKNVAGAIGDAVGYLKDNKTINNTVNNVVSPAMETVAFLSALTVISTSTSIQVSNIILLFIRFGYFWVTIPLSLKKRREPWGVVFDSTTGQPIKSAIVRVFAREFDKLKESQVTDSFGRFGFLLDIGDYYIHVTKPGYVFPSSLITANVLKGFTNIYRGAIINVKEKTEGAININVPIDPERKNLSRAQLARIRILNYISMIIERLNTPLLIVGTLLSWLSLVVTPKLSNYVILFIYAVLLILKLILSRKVRRSWGQVLDSETDKPIEMALVRIYNLKGGMLAFTKVTNKDGQFTALVNTGKYYLVITKPGYQSYQSMPITIERARGIIRLDIYLRKEGIEPKETKFFKEKPVYSA